jgi:Tfp pilus assembly protein PilN
MRAVNLLPKDTNAGKTPKPLVLVGVIGGAVVVFALGGLFFMSSSALSAKEDQLAATQAQLAATPRPETRAPKPQQNAELAGERGPRVAAVSAALAGRVSWDRILRRFSAVLPDDVWLQTLSASAPATGRVEEQPAGAAIEGFTITGRTYSHDGVARLLARLTALPDLENVKLKTSHLVSEDGPSLVEFTIVANVRPDGASA